VEVSRRKQLEFPSERPELRAQFRHITWGLGAERRTILRPSSSVLAFCLPSSWQSCSSSLFAFLQQLQQNLSVRLQISINHLKLCRSVAASEQVKRQEGEQASKKASDKPTGSLGFCLFYCREAMVPFLGV